MTRITEDGRQGWCAAPRLRAQVSMAESVSAAARRNGCQAFQGRLQTTRWAPGDDTALCTSAPRQSGGIICTEHGLIVPQRRRIGPSTPPDPDAPIDDCQTATDGRPSFAKDAPTVRTKVRCTRLTRQGCQGSRPSRVPPTALLYWDDPCPRCLGAPARLLPRLAVRERWPCWPAWWH